ncbi:MAG TPA: GNAT family N-acetyltransferase [Noviherbaspirillum sp.]|uniref:GNAT family N-acetyltransferase n=1 Tax=Noviherbaspirillum sp. TaxID=1926288 RepID=UPI002B49F710|nr:GNAT family N-acetyltransferase [Noviherbaspirillum sp.]HJV84470.1 GNAT family N-acetyltransferase [Noviherbaspirillum sp.]
MGKHTSITWLNLDDGAERAVYEKYWEESEHQRPHDHPGFLELVRPEHYQPAAVVCQHEEGARIIYPFFHCSVNSFLPFREVGQSWRHLVSPYGYGGALFEGKAEHMPAASQAFEFLFSQELKERHFVSEFVREDIFPERLACRTQGEVEQQPNVLVRLDRAPDDIWSNYKHAVRSNVNRARKSGLRVEFDQSGVHLASFLEIYYQTMTRRSAASSYYFSAERFRQLAFSLGKRKATMYVHVYDQDQIVSSELLLLSHDTIYSFLGGSLASAFAKRPNNLLKHEVILWGGRNGYKWLVLGGGVAPGDELFRFKQSFDPGHVAPFTVRRIVHDPDAFGFLEEVRRRHEHRNGRCWQPAPGFFPQYLAPAENLKDEGNEELRRSGPQ